MNFFSLVACLPMCLLYLISYVKNQRVVMSNGLYATRRRIFLWS